MGRQTTPVTARVGEVEKTRIEAAAAAAGVSRSRFIRNAARRAAERDLRRMREERSRDGEHRGRD